jgi:hypothetical protein
LRATAEQEIFGKPAMNLATDQGLRALKASLLEGMRAYMRRAGEPYSEADVQRCSEILDRFEAAISGAVAREDALAHVRETVLDLNALNNTCGGNLIETDQREMICELIIQTTARRGFIAPGEDVTLEWREW